MADFLRIFDKWDGMDLDIISIYLILMGVTFFFGVRDTSWLFRSLFFFLSLSLRVRREKLYLVSTIADV